MAGKRNILGVLDKVSSNAITVRPARCAVVRNRNVECAKCADACTSNCIHFEDGIIAVDASKCVGCGTCATVCPTCALETHNPSDLQLLADCKKRIVDGEVTIACNAVADALGDSVDQSALGRVVCLGRVEESLASGLAAAGAKTIELLCGDCSKCKQEHGRKTAELVADTSNALFKAWGSDANVALTDEVPAYIAREDGGVLHKRLKAAFANGVEAPLVFADAVDQDADDNGDDEQEGTPVLRVMRDGTLPHFVPDRRERLLDNLACLGDPGSATVNTRLWGYVVINGMKCTSCRMCATFCPTAAIRKFDDPETGTFGVDHSPIDCVKCGSCRDICPEGAIMLVDDVKADFLMSGDVHHYVMKERAVKLNDAQQIYNTMRQYIDGDMYER